MNKILITGGAGFIGSNLIEELFKRNSVNRVICVDNLDPFYSVVFKKDNLKSLSKNKKFCFYKVNIVNLASLKKVFKREKPDFVIHLAAKTDTRKSVKEPYDYHKVNVLGTLNLLELSKEYGIKKFIFISSSSVYGDKAKSPFKESDSAIFPLSPYGATKRAGELLCHTYSHNFNLPVVCLRVFNVYGRNNRPDLVIYKWVENILKGKTVELSGRGVRKRDYTHVDDVVRGILLALDKAKDYKIINLGNSQPISLKNLLLKIEKTIGKKARIKSRPSSHASVESTCADIKEAKKVLDWKPEVSMEEGLEKFIKWFRDNRL